MYKLNAMFVVSSEIAVAMVVVSSEIPALEKTVKIFSVPLIQKHTQTLSNKNESMHALVS